ncbi:oxidoreductase, partial [Rhizobium johnstonii]
MSDSFTAMVIDTFDGKQQAAFRQLTVADLPDHYVLVEVAFSTVNYKDCLALSGKIDATNHRRAARNPSLAG